MQTINWPTTFYNSKLLQVVFMIGERKGVQGLVICNVVAVIIHFTTLATFFWTNIMAWDIYKTFGQRTVLSHIRPKGYFLNFSKIYCLLLFLSRFIFPPILGLWMGSSIDHYHILYFNWYQWVHTKLFHWLWWGRLLDWSFSGKFCLYLLAHVDHLLH